MRGLVKTKAEVDTHNLTIEVQAVTILRKKQQGKKLEQGGPVKNKEKNQLKKKIVEKRNKKESNDVEMSDDDEVAVGDEMVLDEVELENDGDYIPPVVEANEPEYKLTTGTADREVRQLRKKDTLYGDIGYDDIELAKYLNTKGEPTDTVVDVKGGHDKSKAAASINVNTSRAGMGAVPKVEGSFDGANIDADIALKPSTVSHVNNDSEADVGTSNPVAPNVEYIIGKPLRRERRNEFTKNATEIESIYEDALDKLTFKIKAPEFFSIVPGFRTYVNKKTRAKLVAREGPPNAVKMERGSVD